ncbi:hypothetical protein BV22DRAFT_1036997 [Leucogyrophana mollusca]|uniref:Uncharacterized protein n=1 Tax=Leucogyrophana mollusca TaxID=85980 RepID=A0ACB8BB87_9AGAM|nr:hypothetical protein BV22DRAFT_1036997 [Leucogyrophana mollusca]
MPTFLWHIQQHRLQMHQSIFWCYQQVFCEAYHFARPSSSFGPVRTSYFIAHGSELGNPASCQTIDSPLGSRSTDDNALPGSLDHEGRFFILCYALVLRFPGSWMFWYERVFTGFIDQELPISKP